MMNREQALIVAKLAYKDMMKVVLDWEETGDNGELVNFHWDECISVDEWLFHTFELRDRGIL